MCVGPSGRCVTFGICRWKSWLQIGFPPTTIDTFLLQYLMTGALPSKRFWRNKQADASPGLMCSSIFLVIQVEFVEIRLRLNMICGLIQAAVKVPVRFLINCSPVARSQVGWLWIHRNTENWWTNAQQKMRSRDVFKVKLDVPIYPWKGRKGLETSRKH